MTEATTETPEPVESAADATAETTDATADSNADTIVDPTTAPIDAPDAAAASAADERMAGFAGGRAAFGNLADLASWAASVRASTNPDFERVRCVVFAGDVLTPEDTLVPGGAREQATTIIDGGGPYPLLAERGDASVRVIDIGISDGPIEGIERYEEELEIAAALATGAGIADEEIDAGADLLIPAAFGAGARIPASTVVAAITDTEPVRVLGFDHTGTPEAWMRECEEIRDRLRSAKLLVSSPREMLAAAGGEQLAVLVGFLIQAAVRRTPVLLDGTIVTAAALVARELSSDAAQWWHSLARSGGAAEKLAADALKLGTVGSVGLRLGDGTGSLAALPTLRLAIELLAGLGKDDVTD